MAWTTPAATDLRFGFEITMYIANRSFVSAAAGQPPGLAATDRILKDDLRVVFFCSFYCHSDNYGISKPIDLANRVMNFANEKAI